MEPSIREAVPAQTERLAALVRDSYRDVAERFSLTPENAPTHPSNCAPSCIEADLARGVTYFVAESGGAACGCVGLERTHPRSRACGVSPHCPGSGAAGSDARWSGTRSKWRAVRARARSAVRAGVIADHAELIGWYRRLGFEPIGRERFDHLPFAVAFLSLPLRTRHGV